MKTISSKKYNLLLALILLLMLLGAHASVMHWDTNKYFVKIGLVVLGCVYFLRFLHKPAKNLLDFTKLGLIAGYISLRFLIVYHLAGVKINLWTVILITLVWIGLEIFGKLSKRFEQLNPIIYIGMVFMMLEVLFKIKHWPLSFLFNFGGLTMLIVGFLVDDYRQKKLNLN
jgi:hypothetical protein